MIYLDSAATSFQKPPTVAAAMDLANSTAPFGLAFAQMFTPSVGKVIMMRYLPPSMR